MGQAVKARNRRSRFLTPVVGGCTAGMFEVIDLGHQGSNQVNFGISILKLSQSSKIRVTVKYLTVIYAHHRNLKYL